MLTSYNHRGHSAEIDMQLLVNGSILPVAQLGPNFLIVRQTIDHPPTEATIVMRVDASERRWSVNLPDGLSAARERVAIQAID